VKDLTPSIQSIISRVEVKQSLFEIKNTCIYVICPTPIDTFAHACLGHSHKTIDGGFYQATGSLTTPTLVSDYEVRCADLVQARHFPPTSGPDVASPDVAARPA